MATLRTDTTATAVVARLEHHAKERYDGAPEVALLRWSNAGHPGATVLLYTDGLVERLDALCDGVLRLL